MEPLAYRPLHNEYLTVGKILRWYANDFYKIGIEQFVKDCVYESNGAMSPNQASKIYWLLMEEAGLL